MSWEDPKKDGESFNPYSYRTNPQDLTGWMKMGPGESKETFVLAVKIVKIALIHALVAKSVLFYVPVKPFRSLFSSWSWRSCLDGISWGEFIIKLFCVIFALDKIHICTGQKCFNFLSLSIFVTLVERLVLSQLKTWEVRMLKANSNTSQFRSNSLSLIEILASTLHIKIVKTQNKNSVPDTITNPLWLVVVLDISEFHKPRKKLKIRTISTEVVLLSKRVGIPSFEKIVDTCWYKNCTW